MSDQRDKNRRREHATHGWREVKRSTSVVALNGAAGILMDCPCSWRGWITA